MAGLKKITRALISVSDKHGIIEFGQALARHHIEIISTGGTAKLLRAYEVNVRDVSDLTGFPEMLDGRVKTLHPKVHGGLLYLRENAEHRRQVHNHNILPIDLAVINLYPFRETIAKPDVRLEDAIENIDIGGPAMVRSAAKNHRDVAVVVEPNDYAHIVELLDANDGALPEDLRFELAVKAFRHTAAYDRDIARYLLQQLPANRNLHEMPDDYKRRAALGSCPGAKCSSRSPASPWGPRASGWGAEGRQRGLLLRRRAPARCSPARRAGRRPGREAQRA